MKDGQTIFYSPDLELPKKNEGNEITKGARHLSPEEAWQCLQSLSFAQEEKRDWSEDSLYRGCFSHIARTIENITLPHASRVYLPANGNFNLLLDEIKKDYPDGLEISGNALFWQTIASALAMHLRPSSPGYGDNLPVLPSLFLRISCCKGEDIEEAIERWA